MDPLRFAVEVGAEQLAFSVLFADQEQAIIGGAEPRAGCILGDAHRNSAARGDAIDARIIGPGGRRKVAAAPAFEDDRAPIGGETRARIVTRLASHGARIAAARADRHYTAQANVGPIDEHQRAAIARPRRKQLETGSLAARQSPRSAARHRLKPQFAKAFEHHLATVGRNFGKARHFG